MQKLLLLLFVAFIFLFTLGSALAADLEIASIDDITAAPGDIATSSFVISNSNPILNATGITCSVSIEGWSTSSSCPSGLVFNSSETASFSVSIPQYTAPGTYSGSLSVSGTLSDDTTSEDSASFDVNVSAAPNIEISWLEAPSNLHQGESQVIEFNVTNTGNILLDIEVNVTSTPELVSSSSSVLLEPAASEKIALTIEASSSTKVWTYTLKVSAVGESETDETADVTKESEKSFDVFYQYCIVREDGHIALQSIVNEYDISGEEFAPLDSFDVDVRVRNSDSEKHYAVVRAVLLYDSNEIDETEVKEEVKIRDYDSEKISFTMKIPADIEEGYHYLYVKVYDEDNRDNCQQHAIRFRVEKGSYLVLPHAVEIEPTKASCGQSFKVSGRVANIGSHDEDKVKVIYGDDFGNSHSKVFNDLEEGSLSSLFSFESEIPEDTDEGSHTATLHVYYDYDDVSGDYEKDKKYEYYLTVEGNCLKPEEEEEGEIDVSLTTQLVELVGKKVNVFISVKNTGDTAETYAIDATCGWAIIDSISQPELMIEPGQSKSVIIELTPEEETEEGIYYLEVGVSVGEIRETKSIPVNVQKHRPSTLYQKLKALASKVREKAREDWLWLTIDAVLLLIIIALVVHFIVRPRMPKFFQRAR